MEALEVNDKMTPKSLKGLEERITDEYLDTCYQLPPDFSLGDIQHRECLIVLGPSIHLPLTRCESH